MRWPRLRVDACGADDAHCLCGSHTRGPELALWCGLLIFLEIIVGLLSNLSDSAPARTGWVGPAILGHCVLAGASVVALVTGLRSPSRRPAAAITAWAVIPVGLGWRVLTSRLLNGS